VVRRGLRERLEARLSNSACIKTSSSVSQIKTSCVKTAHIKRLSPYWKITMPNKQKSDFL